MAQHFSQITVVVAQSTAVIARFDDDLARRFVTIAVTVV